MEKTSNTTNNIRKRINDYLQLHDIKNQALALLVNMAMIYGLTDEEIDMFTEIDKDVDILTRDNIRVALQMGISKQKISSLILQENEIDVKALIKEEMCFLNSEQIGRLETQIVKQNEILNKIMEDQMNYEKELIKIKKTKQKAGLIEKIKLCLFGKADNEAKRKKKMLSLLGTNKYNPEQIEIIMQAYESPLTIAEIERLANPEYSVQRMRAIYKIMILAKGQQPDEIIETIDEKNTSDSIGSSVSADVELDEAEDEDFKEVFE